MNRLLFALLLVPFVAHATGDDWEPVSTLVASSADGARGVVLRSGLTPELQLLDLESGRVLEASSPSQTRT